MRSAMKYLQSFLRSRYCDRGKRRVSFGRRTAENSGCPRYAEKCAHSCFDEATAFADPENEAAMQRAFEKLAEGRTVVMIAHRLTTVQNADRIYVLKEGKIAEQGKHEQLMAKKGTYNDMYEEYRTAVTWKVGGVR